MPKLPEPKFLIKVFVTQSAFGWNALIRISSESVVHEHVTDFASSLQAAQSDLAAYIESLDLDNLNCIIV